MATMKIVSIWPRAIAMTGQGQLIYLVSYNKCICIWHRHHIYISNTWIVRASKQINSLHLDNNNKKYNPIEVLIKSDESNMFDLSDFIELSNISTIPVY